MSTNDENRLRELALNLLARREHSRFELQRKLSTKTAARCMIDRVLDQLAKERLQSDRRFVVSYIDSRRVRGFGPLKICAELKAKGVDQQLIDSILESQAAGWDETLLEVVRGRFGSETAIDFKEWSKRARFLEYRGFSPARIRRLLPHRAW